MFNKEQAISILIQAAHVAQASGKLKLQEAAMIAQAVAILEIPPTADQEKKVAEVPKDTEAAETPKAE